MTFERNCSNPFPIYGGLTCQELTGEMAINTTTCPARKYFKSALKPIYLTYIVFDTLNSDAFLQ
jgi:hypothetical protein